MKRRQFLQYLSASIVALPLFRAFSEDKKAECPPPPVGVKIVTSDAAPGKAQEYVAVAADSKNAKYKAGDNCANCKHYKKDKENAGHAPCVMMGNKFVAACGWCKIYAKKA